MKIKRYLYCAEQRGRMRAATINPNLPIKNECPIEGHPFLLNNGNGLQLSHLLAIIMLSCMESEKV